MTDCAASCEVNVLDVYIDVKKLTLLGGKNNRVAIITLLSLVDRSVPIMSLNLQRFRDKSIGNWDVLHLFLYFCISVFGGKNVGYNSS